MMTDLSPQQQKIFAFITEPCVDAGCTKETRYVMPGFFDDPYWQHGENPEHVLPRPETPISNEQHFYHNTVEVRAWLTRIHSPGVFDGGDDGVDNG